MGPQLVPEWLCLPVLPRDLFCMCSHHCDDICHGVLTWGSGLKRPPNFRLSASKTELNKPLSFILYTTWYFVVITENRLTHLYSCQSELFANSDPHALVWASRSFDWLWDCQLFLKQLTGEIVASLTGVLGSGGGLLILISWSFLERVRRPENNAYITRVEKMDHSREGPRSNTDPLLRPVGPSLYKLHSQSLAVAWSTAGQYKIQQWLRDEGQAVSLPLSWALTLKISAIFRCWGNEQWFSIDMMIGRSEVMKAFRSMASTTSYGSQTAYQSLRLCPGRSGGKGLTDTASLLTAACSRLGSRAVLAFPN